MVTPSYPQYISCNSLFMRCIIYYCESEVCQFKSMNNRALYFHISDIFRWSIQPLLFIGTLLHHHPEGRLQGQDAPLMGHKAHRCRAREMSPASDPALDVPPATCCTALQYEPGRSECFKSRPGSSTKRSIADVRMNRTVANHHRSPRRGDPRRLKRLVFQKARTVNHPCPPPPPPWAQ